MNRRYLALDLGAESGRGMLADIADGKIELTDLRRFANTPVRLLTGLYWDTLRLFHKICESIRTAASGSDHLDGIGIDTWDVDFGLIGRDGSLIGNPRHYRDARTHGVPEELFRIVPRHEIFRQTGVQFMEINSLYQLYALGRDSPDLLGLTSKLLFMPDLFNYFLTGSFASETTVASTSQFYDPLNKVFATAMLRTLGIDGGLLAELAGPGSELGSVLPYVSELCGLKYKTVVYATASHDTTSAVAAAYRRLNGELVLRQFWHMVADGSGNNASLAANFTNEVGVAGTIRFLKNIPGLWLLQECRRAWGREGHEYSYAELIERAVLARPIRTLIDLDEFTSCSNPPERIRGTAEKTAQEIPEDVGSMTRVILESVAGRYKEVLELLEKLTGRRIDVIHTAVEVGGSRNKLLNQLAADFTGRHVIAGPAEATAAGNALVQALGAGDIGSLEELKHIVSRSFAVEEFTPRT